MISRFSIGMKRMLCVDTHLSAVAAKGINQGKKGPGKRIKTSEAKSERSESKRSDRSDESPMIYCCTEGCLLNSIQHQCDTSIIQ